MSIRLSRRGWIAVLAGVPVASGLRWGEAQPVGAHGEEELTAVELPPPLGETDLRVYFADTGHSLGGVFLDYWRAGGGAAVYGGPISEPFAAANGYHSQAFERTVLQYRPDYLFTVEPIIRSMPIGRALFAEPADTLLASGKRRGGDRRLAWAPLGPDSEAVARVVAEGGLFDEVSGHTISGAFLDWYRAHEGDFILGAALGEPVTEYGLLAQYFEGGRLQFGPNGVALTPVGARLAQVLGIDTAPLEPGGLPLYDEALFHTGDNPNPLGDPAAVGPRRIEISLGQQRLWAYQGETLVSSGLVSSGLAPHVTEQGVFRVRLKYPLQDMRGFTDATGEVVAVGADAPPGVAGYAVDDVPDVMYFNMEAEALHGAYWHNNFGWPTSHGCVNLPLDMARFLYGWAPLGTRVSVYE